MKRLPHQWKRVPPVVTGIGNPNERPERGTYNAICENCGAKAWLHWPPAYRQEVNKVHN